MSSWHIVVTFRCLLHKTSTHHTLLQHCCSVSNIKTCIGSYPTVLCTGQPSSDAHSVSKRSRKKYLWLINTHIWTWQFFSTTRRRRNKGGTTGRTTALYQVHLVVRKLRVQQAVSFYCMGSLILWRKWKNLLSTSVTPSWKNSRWTIIRSETTQVLVCTEFFSSLFMGMKYNMNINVCVLCILLTTTQYCQSLVPTSVVQNNVAYASYWENLLLEEHR